MSKSIFECERIVRRHKAGQFQVKQCVSVVGLYVRVLQEVVPEAFVGFVTMKRRRPFASARVCVEPGVAIMSMASVNE